MPVDEEDKFGFKLIGKNEPNFYYLNSKNFIEQNNLKPEKGKKSNKYEAKWLEEKGWLIAEVLK